MKAIWTLAVVATATFGITQGAQAAGDATAGEEVFHKCLACHAIGPGAKTKVGPELNGLDGRHSGSVPEYNYSEANKSSGIVWNEQTFKQYIKDPKAMIPKTKMFFPGITKETDIDNLWAYLSQFDAQGNKKAAGAAKPEESKKPEDDKK